jgi:hypothetical protein
MKPFTMNYFTNWDMTMLSSIGALTLSFITGTIEEPNIMAWVSGISAILLCLTSIVKFIDLIAEKWEKWTKKD